jgi:hypothetical protein
MVQRGWVVVAAALLTLTACGSDGSSPTAGSRPAPVPRRIVLAGTDEVDPLYAQGIAPWGPGWVLSGTATLGHTDATGVVQDQVNPVIPPEWAAQGYDHVGDVDVAGAFLYVPLEQSDYDRNEQVMARYSATTLRFVDATKVRQHHNSFVAVDGTARIAYSTSWFDDDTLLRYDLTRAWKPLKPLKMSQTLERIQGGAIGGGAFWISTDDERNGVYRVDLKSGAVRFMGSMGHGEGEGEGIAYVRRPDGAALHTLTVDVRITPVYLDHWTLER